ncbi:Uncharacterised protein [Mycobacteroides abscessus subsp. abscessus]|nr:Uncharacterised protein [Mycobacteroides abscessus subsp. abscessus]
MQRSPVAVGRDDVEHPFVARPCRELRIDLAEEEGVEDVSVADGHDRGGELSVPGAQQ